MSTKQTLTLAKWLCGRMQTRPHNTIPGLLAVRRRCCRAAYFVRSPAYCDWAANGYNAVRGYAMPTAYEFKTKSELVNQLRSVRPTLVKQSFVPKESLPYLIEKSVQGNTFRGFWNLDTPPSVIYRGWASSRLSPKRAETLLMKVGHQGAFDKILKRLAGELADYWAELAGRPLDFGPQHKLINLLLKSVVCWTGYSPETRKHLLQFLHVPLDEYSLRAIRQIVREVDSGASLRIPSNSSSRASTSDSPNSRTMRRRSSIAPNDVPRRYVPLSWKYSRDVSLSM